MYTRYTKHAQLMLTGLVVILVTMALGVVYFMTLPQIESAEREERWAKQDAESAARIAKLRSNQGKTTS